MKVLTLLDGSAEIICNDEEIKEVVYDNLGDDAAECIQRLIDKADYTTRKIDTDLMAYESSLESNTSAFLDIQYNIDELLSYVTKTKRMDRDKIKNLLINTLGIISNQI